jgi:hypothetical protein
MLRTWLEIFCTTARGLVFSGRKARIYNTTKNYFLHGYTHQCIFYVGDFSTVSKRLALHSLPMSCARQLCNYSTLRITFGCLPNLKIFQTGTGLGICDIPRLSVMDFCDRVLAACPDNVLAPLVQEHILPDSSTQAAVAFNLITPTIQKNSTSSYSLNPIDFIHGSAMLR